MRTYAAAVLGLVFLDEVAAMAAFGYAGSRVGAFPLNVVLTALLPVLAMLAWFLFASPKARHGGVVVRPLAKVIVFGLAAAALWAAGEPGWALALLVASILVNALAQTSPVQAMIRELEEQAGRVAR